MFLVAVMVVTIHPAMRIAMHIDKLHVRDIVWCCSTCFTTRFFGNELPRWFDGNQRAIYSKRGGETYDCAQ